MQKRIDYIDTAKGIAILAVVVSHAISNSNTGLTVDHPILLNWLSFFNVSTFFFINGFLYNEKSIDSPIKSILKKIKAYYIPFVSYNLFFLIIQNPLVKMHVLDESHLFTSFSDFIKAVIQALFGKMQTLTGPMWFLRALILLSIMYIVIDSISGRIFNGRYRYVINGIIAVILFFLPGFSFTPIAFNFPSACEAFILYFLGVVFKRFSLNTYMQKYSIPICLSTFIISVIIGRTVMVGIYGSISPVLDFISMIISVIFVISLSQFYLVKKIHPLMYIGKSSLEIMALHFFAFKPISLLMIRLCNLDISYLIDIPVVMRSGISDIWPFLYSLAGIALPAAFYTVKTKVRQKRLSL